MNPGLANQFNNWPRGESKVNQPVTFCSSLPHRSHVHWLTDRGAHVITDLEGQHGAIDALVAAGKMCVKEGQLEFVDPADCLYFAGDITDRGPFTLRLTALLMDLRRRYPERVAWVYGNLDVKSLGLLRNLPALECRTSGFDAWLLAQAERDAGANGIIWQPPTSGKREALLARRNTLDQRVEYWLCMQGATQAFEYHRQELGEMRGRAISRLEAAQDYVARLLPGGEAFEFLRLGQIALVHGNVLIDHGGVSRSNIGFIPGATGRSSNARIWVEDLNAYARAQITAIEQAIRTRGLGEHIPDGFLRYADAIWDATAQEGNGALFMNDVSLIYPFRQKEEGNFRAPDVEAIDYLLRAGIDSEIVGHSPFGDVPGPLKANGFLRVMADTSRRRSGALSTILIDGRGGVRVSGQTSQGEAIRYRVTAQSPAPIGHVTEDGGYTVVGRTRANGATHYLMTKYFDGYNIKDLLVTRAQLTKLKPEPAVAKSIPQEQERHFSLLIDELQRKGKQILTLDDVIELIGNRTPVVVSGFSKYGHSPIPEAAIDAEAHALLEQIGAPDQNLLITGGTDNGFEHAVHEAALDNGFEVVGFIQRGAIAGEIGLVNKVAFAGVHDDWSAPLLAALSLAKSKGGFAVFVGGGEVVMEGIRHAVSLELDYYLLRRCAEIQGNGGASAEFAANLSCEEQARYSIGSLGELRAALARRCRQLDTDGNSSGPAREPHRVGVYAGSFDPPHLGHRDLVERMRTEFDLDLVYVVPDRVTRYKDLQPLTHRVRMLELLFESVMGVRVPPPDLEAQLGEGEMWDVLQAVQRYHPGAQVFNIVGSDTLRWLAGLPPSNRPAGVTLLVNDRHDGTPLPASLDNQQVLTIDDLDRGLSSTQIRGELAEQRQPTALPIQVFDYIRRWKLYGTQGRIEETPPLNLNYAFQPTIEKENTMLESNANSLPVIYDPQSLTFEEAALVLPSQDRVKALRFSLPVPCFDGEELRYPTHYPQDMRNRDGSTHALAGQPHRKAGRALENWQGKPVLNPEGAVPRGVVFFNYEDCKYQGVQSTGTKILLFNHPSPAQAHTLQDYITRLGGPSALTSLDRIKAVLEFTRQQGLDDRYDSDLTYVERSLTPVAEMATGIAAYGLHLRSNEMVRAVFVPGPGQMGDLLFGKEGAVFLLVSVKLETGERDFRQVSPHMFAQTYTGRDGEPITAEELPIEWPKECRVLAETD